MFRPKTKRIIITGGHLAPALALIKKLKPEKKWEILFIGRKYALEAEKTISVEYRTIKKLGIRFMPLTTGRLQRRLTPQSLTSLLKTPLGVVQSLWWVAKERPKIIVSFGGYLALPVALAGWLVGVPIVTHEQSVVPGLTTKIISLFAKRVCLSWPQTRRYLKRQTVLTGNPLREEIFKKNPKSKIQISQEDLPLVYITGGTLGAHSINKIVEEILPRLLNYYRIIHQSGESRIYRDYENLSAIELKLSAKRRNRYFLTKYLDSGDIGWVLANADLVISRAGANIVSELAALGKPAILIPLPWAAAGEQLENARLLEKAGLALILSQEKLTPSLLLNSLKAVTKNLDKYKENAPKAQKLVDLTAAAKLMKVINEVVNETKS